MYEKPEGEVPQAQTPQQDRSPVTVKDEEWRPHRQEYLIMTSLSLISLMVALDSAILAPALPVRVPPSYHPPQIFQHSEYCFEPDSRSA
jgi:hypothetical protein